MNRQTLPGGLASHRPPSENGRCGPAAPGPGSAQAHEPAPCSRGAARTAQPQRRAARAGPRPRARTGTRPTTLTSPGGTAPANEHAAPSARLRGPQRQPAVTHPHPLATPKGPQVEAARAARVLPPPPMQCKHSNMVWRHAAKGPVGGRNSVVFGGITGDRRYFGVIGQRPAVVRR